MFKRSNFIAKYKQYLKFKKSSQFKIEQCTSTLKENTKKLDIVAQECNNVVLSKVKNILNHKEVLTIIHNKITDRFQYKKSNVAVGLPTSFGASLAGVSLFKKDPITITGYSDSDKQFLKELGVLDANTPAESNIPPETNETSTDSFNDTNNNDYSQDTAFENSTNFESASTNYPASLFTNNTEYSSVLNNLPEERNDLYSVFVNAFAKSKEQSTQVDSSQLVNVTHEIHENSKEPEFFVVETPGKPSVTIDETNTTSLANNELTEEVIANASVVEDFAAHSNEINQIFHAESEPQITVEAIPDPPEAPDLAAELASTINALGEPTFSSQGLGGWSPIGLVQTCFELLHVNLGVPWWVSIAIGTLVIRLAMFPLVIIAQRNAARMNNYLPQMQVLQMKMTEARQSGNQMETARLSQELLLFMKEKQVSPLKNLIVPLAQMPVFISFFVGLRQMANLPVDSMRQGGLFWFTDLTVPDQYFILPVITSLTLWATIELGTDGAKLTSQNLQTMKYVLRAMPLIILPFTSNFPGAILCYWVSSNFISLVQVGFLRIPAVREHFKIEAMVKHTPDALPMKSKGFVGGLKDSWTNMKISKDLEERRRLDELQFQRAGKGPLVKTYKYDPTKQSPTTKSANAVSAKGR